MRICDICRAPATKFLRVPQYAFGTHTAFGSFQSYRCTRHGAEAKKDFEAKGYAVEVTPVRVEYVPAATVAVRVTDLERRVQALEEKKG